MTALLLVLMGCVPKGRYEVTTVQLGATRTALSAQVQRCAADQQVADEATAALQAEIALRQAQLDELSALRALDVEEAARRDAQLVGLTTELAQLTLAYDALVAASKRPPPPVATPVADGLSDELVAGLVERQRYASELARREASHAEVAAAFAGLVAEGRAEVEVRGEGMVVRFPTALLFQEGFTTLSPRGSQVVAAAAEALATLKGRRVVVEGHTDDRPLHSAEWPSNWERGFSRAVAVLRALEAAGVPETLSAASYADTRPLVAPGSEGSAARNDRVELYVSPDPSVPEAFAPTPPATPPPPEEGPVPAPDPG